MNSIERAMEGAEGQSLTTFQRRRIMGSLVRPAWRAHFSRFPGQEPEDFDAWRAEEFFKAVGKTSLRTCTQSDWPGLQSYFLRMLGCAQAARRVDERRLTHPREVALSKLREACRTAGDVIERPLDYVCAISKSRFRRMPEACTARELWVLTFDLRRAAQRRRRVARAGGVA